MGELKCAGPHTGQCWIEGRLWQPQHWIVAVHAGLKVLGLSVVTDMCLPDALEEASVEKILAVARSAEPKLRSIITATVRDAGAAEL